MGVLKKGSTVQPTMAQRCYNQRSLFKKGNRAWHTKPVGSEVVTKREGITKVKVGDPNKWRYKHHLIWEKHSGKSIPKGHIIVFKDGDVTNLSPDNLDCVSRAVNCVFNNRKTGLNKFSNYETKKALAHLIIEVRK